ncbi:hypothetical protein EPIR_2217 [Erwinia piriflorinigrans CFBP 5888]|uniref:Uncharacterized protein n=2 Tax=Erwinia piriflorinigrans TaxID=665097 RepID=V5Z8B6_9GAMM|nr:hypothetical protein EPIR_2217 [Erwinia piriflorinigrans CFBP 5888]
MARIYPGTHSGRTAMKTVEEYYAIAKERFLEAHPTLKSGIENLTTEQAATLGMSLQQLQSIQKDRAYAAWVREKKLDGVLFAIQLAEPDKEVMVAAIEQYLHTHAEALGMSWEEFCIKNEL